ncbi:NLRC3, partial [Symbiodinium microadriaticum]
GIPRFVVGRALPHGRPSQMGCLCSSANVGSKYETLSTEEVKREEAEKARAEEAEAEEEERKQQEAEAKKREEAEKARAEEAAKHQAEEEAKKKQAEAEEEEEEQQEAEAKKLEEANFNLEEPQKLAAYLKYADIRLLRVKYLYELLRQERLLPRRQEAEDWGLVSHEEVSEWAAGTRDAMLISVSHAWETREHPDPCGDQLKRLVNCLSLYDAAYFSEIWVFYDYVSLFQYERQTDAEYESFRRSMSHMHMCYAHECNWTVRLEALTPDDVWDAALQNSEHLVMVYDDKSKSVRGRPLKELVHNRVPYRDRGWCKAEVEWSSCRSRSEQNQRIDAPGSEVNSTSELRGKVPMAPQVFQEDMKKAAFTHRKKDAEAVQKLQQDIYYEKVSACEEALLTNLPEGELGRLAKVLKDYRKLQVLRLINIEVGEAEAEFGKALGLNDTITKLEIQVARSHRNRCSALWKALANALKSNCTLTHVYFESNKIGDEGAKALADALKSNCTVTYVNLRGSEIGDQGAKALADALKCNCTITHVNLRNTNVWTEGKKALEDAVESNRTVTVHLNGRQLGGKGAKDIQESAEHPADATKSQAWTGKVRIKELASQLTTNSGTTRLELRGQLITAEKCQALADALNSNRTVISVDLEHNYIGDQGAKALADSLKSNCTVAVMDLGFNEFGDEGAKALADALKSNCTVTHVNLYGNRIRDEGAKALADSLKSNCTVAVMDLGFNEFGDEGAKALRGVGVCVGR